MMGYASTSYYLLKNPEKLHIHNHKTKELYKGKKVVYAHRGGSIEHPENTLQAFKASAKLGAAIETDVRCTKDGTVLVCHDPNFKRLGGKDALIVDTPLAEVPKSYASKFMIEFGHHDYEVKKTDEARYCTLDELFATLPKT